MLFLCVLVPYVSHPLSTLHDRSSPPSLPLSPSSFQFLRNSDLYFTRIVYPPPSLPPSPCLPPSLPPSPCLPPSVPPSPFTDETRPLPEKTEKRKKKYPELLEAAAAAAAAAAVASAAVAAVAAIAAARAVAAGAAAAAAVPGGVAAPRERDRQGRERCCRREGGREGRRKWLVGREPKGRRLVCEAAAAAAAAAAGEKACG